MSTVENNVTLCYTKRNTTQLSLWDAPAPTTPEQETHIIPFRWANGDTSEAAAQRMLAQVQGHQHKLVDWEYIDGHLVAWYAQVLDAWIEQGVCYGRCVVHPSGAYVRAVQSGQSLDEEEDDAA